MDVARFPEFAPDSSETHAIQPLSGPERAPFGLVSREIGAGSWAWRASAPGYASSYGVVLADEPELRMQTVRLERGATLRGVVASAGDSTDRLRVECVVNFEHSASQARLDLLAPGFGLDALFERERHVTFTGSDGAFELQDLPAAAFAVTITCGGQTLWEAASVVTHVGRVTDLGQLR